MDRKFEFIPRNKEILDEVLRLEEKINKAEAKAYKCPMCKDGYYHWEDNGGDWLSIQAWAECNKCGHCATPHREELLNAANFYIRSFEEYLTDLMFDFEHPNDWNKKEREFSPEAFNAAHITTKQGKVLVWEDEVDECYKLYVEELKQHIENMKEYPLFRRYLK